MIRRGDIWWAELPEPRGSEPGFRRPVLVVQSNDFNASRLSTVLTVILTSNVELADAPGNVLLPRASTKLGRDSVANISQVYTLDRRFLHKRVGPLSAADLRRVESGLRLATALH